MTYRGSLEISIVDVNEFAPEFGMPSYKVEIKESTKEGVTLFRNIAARDMDKGPVFGKFSLYGKATLIGKTLFMIVSFHESQQSITLSIKCEETNISFLWSNALMSSLLILQVEHRFCLERFYS